MPLINCRFYPELNWIEDCTLSNARDSAKFAITDAKLHVPIVTLSTKDDAILTKQLNERFKRSVYWNSYETKSAKVIEKGKNLYEVLNASFQGVKRLFVLPYVIAASTAAGGNSDNTAGIKSNKNYFLPRGKIENYDDYTTGCLLHYTYFKDNCRLIAVDLSKQKALDADPRAIQQIVFQGVVGGANNTKIRLYTILEQSKETMLEFSKGTANVL